jgi:Zn-dependent protease with chaperone function
MLSFFMFKNKKFLILHARTNLVFLLYRYYLFYLLFQRKIFQIMNTKKLKFLCAAILCINVLQSPIQATIKNEDTTFCPDIMPGIYTAAALYFGYNYLIRQEYLVKNKYPVAQAWYDMLAEKYPAAHLNQKQFVQTPKISLIPDQLTNFAKSCSWSSNHDHIYFTDADLGEITFLYQKMLDGYPLHEDEQLALARKEFIILHEAGHIEHDDAKDLLITIFALFATIEGIEYVLHDTTEPSITSREVPKDYTVVPMWPFESMTTVPGIATTAQGITFMTGLIAMIRYQESRADKFACKIADENALKGAITLFEDESIDPLYGMENRKITPYITTESTVGKVIQTVTGPIEFILSACSYKFFMFIRSIPETRWLHDFTKDAIHQGPSIRAKLAKDELARREQSKLQ